MSSGRQRSSFLAGLGALGPAVLLAVFLLACGDSRPSAAPTAVPPASAQPAVSAVRRAYLTHGQARSPGQAALDRLKKVDLAGEHSTGNLTVEVNDPQFAPRFSVIIDGDVKSMTRSEGVNPLILTLTFREPIALASVRIYPAGSPYDWLVEPTPGGPRLMIEGAADSSWSQIDLDQPATTSVVRLEILRRERDDYVHVNEIELYTKP